MIIELILRKAVVNSQKESFKIIGNKYKQLNLDFLKKDMFLSGEKKIEEDIFFLKEKKSLIFNHWRNARETSLELSLIGTAVFKNSMKSLALIMDLSNPNGFGIYSLSRCNNEIRRISKFQDIVQKYSSFLFIPCNEIMNFAIVKRIEFDKVYIFNIRKECYEYLLLNKKIKKKVIQKEGLDQDNDSTIFYINQLELNNVLDNIEKLTIYAKVVPVFKNGISIGLRFFSIIKNSIFSRIGLRNGDIITQINEYKINTPNQALAFYKRLKEIKYFKANIMREGKIINFEYNVN